MNNSWKNSVNNISGGFVYFNTSNSYPNNLSHNSSETSDFLSFGSESTSSNGSPQSNYFSPSNCSSPNNHFNGRSPRTRGGRKYYSPIKQIGKNKFWRKNLGLTGSSNPDVSTATNCNEKFYNQHPVNTRRNPDNTSYPNSRQSVFFEPTCVKDPWFDLEKTFSEEKIQCDSAIENKGLVKNELDKQDIDFQESLENASSDSSESEEDTDEMENSLS